MKSKKERADDKKSIQNNSMSPGGKSPAPAQNKKSAPEEFSEDRSIKLRMKSQPLGKDLSKSATKNKK